MFLGHPGPIARDISAQMKKLEIATKDNDELTLNIALNYGGRDEIVRAAQKFSVDTLAGRAKPQDLTIEKFETYLDTKNQPNPDLILRTAGQQRISNFLLWRRPGIRCAYLKSQSSTSIRILIYRAVFALLHTPASIFILAKVG